MPRSSRGCGIDQADSAGDRGGGEAEEAGWLDDACSLEDGRLTGGVSVRWDHLAGGTREAPDMELVELCADGLPGLAGRVLGDPDEQHGEPAEPDVGPDAILSAVVDRAQVEGRLHFPRPKRLDDFDLAAAPTIPPATLATFASRTSTSAPLTLRFDKIEVHSLDIPHERCSQIGGNRNPYPHGAAVDAGLPRALPDGHRARHRGACLPWPMITRSTTDSRQHTGVLSVLNVLPVN